MVRNALASRAAFEFSTNRFRRSRPSKIETETTDALCGAPSGAKPAKRATAAAARLRVLACRRRVWSVQLLEPHVAVQRVRHDCGSCDKGEVAINPGIRRLVARGYRVAAAAVACSRRRSRRPCAVAGLGNLLTSVRWQSDDDEAMSSSSTKPKRYFVNTLPDYDGAPIPLERELWVERCRDTVQRVFTHQGTGFDDCDGGLYVGVAGVAFMAHRVAQSPHFAGDRARLLTKAQTYLGHALSYCDQPQVRADRAMQSAFLLGSAGVWALAAVVANEVARNDDCDNFLARYAAVADICMPVKFLDCGSDEMFVGRAGYLTGLLYLRSRLGREVLPDEKIALLLHSVVQSGREYAKKHRSPCPLMYAYYDVEYLGAAHGLSSILMTLLHFPWFVAGDQTVERDIRASVDFLLHVQTPRGNFPCDLEDVTKPRRSQDELIHWCHGAPGLLVGVCRICSSNAIRGKSRAN
ncbi:hypothetical protein HPB50_018751 [Hyalomma asiaticum]|uniref:Uncharacterized protein n=1 Tax=Hyalomma asiaticum TaxID=266040 RepID=A0ACB7S2K6_HYAAI|nr:hypothetical protein HPB50_018751 [Hyalomma asiaticum]